MIVTGFDIALEESPLPLRGIMFDYPVTEGAETWNPTSGENRTSGEPLHERIIRALKEMWARFRAWISKTIARAVDLFIKTDGLLEMPLAKFGGIGGSIGRKVRDVLEYCYWDGKHSFSRKYDLSPKIRDLMHMYYIEYDIPDDIMVGFRELQDALKPSATLRSGAEITHEIALNFMKRTDIRWQRAASMRQWTLSEIVKILSDSSSIKNILKRINEMDAEIRRAVSEARSSGNTERAKAAQRDVREFAAYSGAYIDAVLRVRLKTRKFVLDLVSTVLKVEPTWTQKEQGNKAKEEEARERLERERRERERREEARKKRERDTWGRWGSTSSTFSIDKALETLGGSRSSSKEDLKRLWKDKALKVHPDRGGSEAAMKEINNARDVLKAAGMMESAELSVLDFF